MIKGNFVAKCASAVCLGFAVLCSSCSLWGNIEELRPPAVLTGISITALPEKNSYSIGEEIDLSGLEITARYTGRSSEVVDEYSISGFDSGTPGYKIITVYYLGFTAQFTVMIEYPGPTLNSISITAYPEKTSYSIGENIDPSGLEITAEYINIFDDADNYNEIIENFSISGFDSNTGGTKEVIIEYNGKFTSFEVTVIARIFTITFDRSGCDAFETPPPKQVTESIPPPTAGNLPEPIPRAGYIIFDGWKTIEENDFDTDTDVTGDITVYAQWKYNLPLTNINYVEPYLEEQIQGTSQSYPIFLPMQIDLGNMSFGSGWEQLLEAIEEINKYVDLDLTFCAMDGVQFDPLIHLSAGKNRIVSLVLPVSATALPDSGISPLFIFFTALSSINGANIKTIGHEAFEGRVSLTSAIFPAAENIGIRAFYGNTSLTVVEIPAATFIDHQAFASTAAAALTIILGSAAPALDSRIFQYVNSPKTVTLLIPFGATGYDETWQNNFTGGNGNITLNIENM